MPIVILGALHAPHNRIRAFVYTHGETVDFSHWTFVKNPREKSEKEIHLSHNP